VEIVDKSGLYEYSLADLNHKERRADFLKHIGLSEKDIQHIDFVKFLRSWQ